MGPLLWAAIGTMQWGEPQAIDPQTYRSPSGRFALHIDPTHPEGKGPADYRLTEGKTLRWSRRLPFTLTEAVVANDGRTAGTGSDAAPNREGNFVVAILDPEGKSLRHERHPIKPSRLLHTEGDPKSNGLILDPTNDRVLVRIDDPDVNRNEEDWWSYRLSTGQPLPPIHPKPGPAANQFIVFAKPVPQTPLILVHWWRYTDAPGATFALLDPAGRPVWSLDKPGDYKSRNEDQVQTKLFREIHKGGGVPSLGPGPTFTLRFYEEGRKATFAVDRKGDSWQVRQTGITAYLPPKPAKPTKAPSSPIRTVQLQPIGKFTIPLQSQVPTPFFDIQSFVLMDRGRLAVLRRGGKKAIVIANQTGRPLRTIPLPIHQGKDEGELTLTWAGGNRLLVFQARNNKTWGWRVDAQTGNIHPLPQPLTPAVNAVAGFSDGSFAVIATEFARSTMTDELARYDANGRLLWRNRYAGYGGKPEELLSPEALAIDPKGQIVVLDNIKKGLFTFDPKGKFLRTAPISPEPGYPTHVTIGPTGKTLVFDFGEPKSLRRLLPNGKPETPAQSPLDPGGKRIATVFQVQLDPQNRIWLSNYKSIFRLDARGRTDLVLGQAPIDRGLREVSSLYVNPAGAVYAVDRDSKEIFVFDPRGRRSFVARPDKTDFTDRDSFSMGRDLEVTPSGDIYLAGTGKGLLKFSPQGRRLGFVPYDDDAEVAPPLRQIPKPDWRWRGPSLIDGKGKTVVRLGRWPDRTWMLGGPSAIAPDGSMVSLDGPHHRRRGPTRRRIAWFSPTGQPQGMATLPAIHDDGFQRAYDGRLLYLIGDRHLYAINRQAQITWRFPLKDKTLTYSVFPSRHGIALFDGVKIVTWYQVPK